MDNNSRIMKELKELQEASRNVSSCWQSFRSHGLLLYGYPSLAASCCMLQMPLEKTPVGNGLDEQVIFAVSDEADYFCWHCTNDK